MKKDPGIEKAKKEAIKIAKNHVCNLIESNTNRIFDAFDETTLNMSGVKITYPVSIRVNFIKTTEGLKIGAAISFGVPFKDSTQVETVSNHPDLFKTEPGAEDSKTS